MFLVLTYRYDVLYVLFLLELFKVSSLACVIRAFVSVDSVMALSMWFFPVLDVLIVSV
jgi:hypothetical protein